MRITITFICLILVIVSEYFSEGNVVANAREYTQYKNELINCYIKHKSASICEQSALLKGMPVYMYDRADILLKYSEKNHLSIYK